MVVAVVLGVARCDWATQPVQDESLVVEAFLDTGESLPPILLRRTAPLRTSVQGTQDAASGAQITLRLGNTSISYAESPSQAGRYVAQRDTVVPPGVHWRLTAKWKGETARATGRTPPRIHISDVCVEVPDSPVQAVRVDSLRRDSLDIPANQEYIYPVDVRVRWRANLTSPGADTTYWVRAQLQPDATAFQSVVEFFLEPADIRREDAFSTRRGVRQWTGVYAVPVGSETAPVPRHTLVTTLTRGDTSFASFAQTRTDPDRREPVSNIQGGQGIAVAVSVDSLVQSIDSDTEDCPRGPSERSITNQSDRPSRASSRSSSVTRSFDHVRQPRHRNHYGH